MENKKLNWFERTVLRRKPEVTTAPSEATKLASDKIITSVSTTSLTTISSIDELIDDERVLNDLYDQMDHDPIISAALDLYADNATLINQKTGHVASVEVPGNKVVQDELNDFLWNKFKVDTEAWGYVRSALKYGKIVIDTTSSDSDDDWTFVEHEKPSEIQALMSSSGKIKYFAITPEVKDDNNYNKFYSYSSINNNEYLDYKVEPGNKYLVGFNSKTIKGTMTVKIDSELSTEESSGETLKIRSGRSLLAPVINTWQTLTNMENAMYVNRLTKSTQFKIVSVDVTNLNNEQAQKRINDVKNVFKNTETLDENLNKYQNRRSPVQVDDLVFIPVKGDQGSVAVAPVGGDMSETPMKDIEYKRNQLFAGLGVLKAYLGFEETTPGGLGDSTLTKLDERFGRSVQRVQNVTLKDILQQALEHYWLNTSSNRALETMPEYNLVLGKVSTKEDQDNRTVLTNNIATAESLIRLMSNEWFIDKIDTEKAFAYIFENILHIDTTSFSVQPNPEDIKINVHDPTFKEGTMESLIKTKDLKLLLKEYDIYLEDEKYNKILLNEAINKTIFKQVLNEKTYQQLKDSSISEDPTRLKKSKKIIIKYTGLNELNNLTFVATAEDPAKNKAAGRPTSYNTEVALKDLAKFLKDQGTMTDKELVMSAIQGDIAVGCNCPASKYWGQQYRGTKDNYSTVINKVAPTVLEPKQVICKHVLTTLTVLPFWWNSIIRDLRNKGILDKTTKNPTTKI